MVSEIRGFQGTVDLARFEDLLELGYEADAEEIESIVSDGGNLRQAARQGHWNVVKLLLEHGVDVNAPDKQNGYPLEAAALNGHLNIIELLLEHGADVNAQGGEYGNPLHAAAFKGHFEIV